MKCTFTMNLLHQGEMLHTYTHKYILLIWQYVSTAGDKLLGDNHRNSEINNRQTKFQNILVQII